MAIAFDAATNGGYNVASYSHTCTGSDLALIATITRLTGGTPTATYNGVSMTSVGSRANTFGWTTTVFVLLNPATGSNTLAFSTTGSDYISGCSSYTGVKQSGFPDSSASIEGAAATSPVTATTTVVASNCWTWAVGFLASSSGPYSLASDKTDRTTGAITGSNGEKYVISDSNATVGTGSQSIIMTGTGSGSYRNSIFILSIEPSVAAGPTNLKSYNTNVKANIKSIDTNATGNIKSLNTNT